VVHPEDSDACDVRPTTASSAGSGRGKGALYSTAYPVRWDQHYDAVVSLKIHRLSLMVLHILPFTNNFFCSST
jgi:hypothetical protein